MVEPARGQLTSFPYTKVSCSHQKLIAGLDAAYCPCCKKSFQPWTLEYKSVLEQPVIENAPEHTASGSVREQPEHTHWVEIYWTKRGNKKHSYYRYCWMDGRKIHHVHIPGGNTANERAIALQEQVTEAIKKGDNPAQIKALIKSNARRRES
jgi:hypothetical protein